VSATADDIERMLTMVEGRQIKCPNCGKSDADLLIPYYDVTNAVWPLIGGVTAGETRDTIQIAGQPRMARCHLCDTTWPLPDDLVIEWNSEESTLCDCERAKQHEKLVQRQLLSLSGEARCDNCQKQVFWVVEGTNRDGIDYGSWFHADTRGCPGERECVSLPGNGSQTPVRRYAQVRAV
jgi:hypothetical protein